MCLVDGSYEPMPAADGALISEQLDLRLALVNGRLELFERVTGAMLVSAEERIQVAEARAVAAEARAAPPPPGACGGAGRRRLPPAGAPLPGRATAGAPAR